jgi:hypothetical protein
MNPLEQNPEARKIVYTAFWVISLIIGTLNVVWMAMDGDFPQWLEIVNVAWGFIAGATGYTARANVDAKSQQQLP